MVAVAESHWPADDSEPPTEPDPEDEFERTRSWSLLVNNRAQQIRLNREAQRLVDDEDRAPVELPPIRSLSALLAESDTDAKYRVDQLAPAGGRVLLSAQYKAGKSTIVGNLMRALVDGDDFLGKFSVRQQASALVLIDDELSEHTVRRWLRAQGIANTAAVADVITLRGNVGSFNLLDERVHAKWVQRLRDLGCDYLILDCLRPILDALGLDENRDAGQFLVPFDALLAEAGIADAALVHHMGHNGERSRGDSRLQDWPDAIWRLVRESDEPDSPRYFSAYGRDVNVSEGRLSFDADTRRLVYADGSRHDAKTEAAMVDVIALLAKCAEGERLSGRDIEAALAGDHTQRAIRTALGKTVQQGFVSVTEGPRRSKLHGIAYPCKKCRLPVASREETHQTCLSGPEGLFT